MSIKAIGILELTVGAPELEIRLNQSLSYYWTKTPIFNRFPIVDVATGTGETVIDKTINLLNKYYNEGYRIFLGFGRSTVVQGVIPWFEQHPDATGVSCTSSSDSLNFPKNIYRLQPTDQTTINSIGNILTNSITSGGKIYYVYSDQEVASLAVLDYLNTTYGSENIKTFPVVPDSSNLTIENIQTFYQDTTSNDVAIIYLFIGTQRDDYISFFNNAGGLDKPFNQYDMTLSGLPVINPTTTTLKTKYNVILNKTVTSTYLWDSGLEYLNLQFSPQALNAVFLITTLVASIPNKNIYSYNGVLQFNENNDIAYYSYGLYEYTSEGLFFPGIVSILDPLYGNVNFTVVV